MFCCLCDPVHGKVGISKTNCYETSQSSKVNPFTHLLFVVTQFYCFCLSDYNHMTSPYIHENRSLMKFMDQFEGVLLNSSVS